VHNGLIEYWQLSGFQARNRPTSTSLIVCCAVFSCGHACLRAVGWLSLVQPVRWRLSTTLTCPCTSPASSIGRWWIACLCALVPSRLATVRIENEIEYEYERTKLLSTKCFPACPYSLNVINGRTWSTVSVHFFHLSDLEFWVTSRLKRDMWHLIQVKCGWSPEKFHTVLLISYRFSQRIEIDTSQSCDGKL